MKTDNDLRLRQNTIISFAGELFEPAGSKETLVIGNKEIKGLTMIAELPNFIATQYFSFSMDGNPLKVVFGDTSSKSMQYSGNASARTLAFKGRYSLIFIKTRKNYGKTLIRKEKLLDKLADLFYRVDIDLPGYREFNRKFYCVSNNPQTFTHSFTKDIAEVLCAHVGDIYVEFGKGFCALSSLTPLTKVLRTKNLLITAKRLASLL